jgi:hypothetical protein
MEIIMAEPDISKIISLIMENPKLIEEIKSLGKEKTESEASIEENKSAEEKETPALSENTEIAQASASINPNKLRRKDLLCALKPYVSEERGRAIDSMMSIADILDMMRTR